MFFPVEIFYSQAAADGLPYDRVEVIKAAPNGSVWIGYKDAETGRFGKYSGWCFRAFSSCIRLFLRIKDLP